jgi:tRNA A-37 threonylcarbamoyl transferase component Bud32/outer membrane biosynthesis protein TonB
VSAELQEQLQNALGKLYILDRELGGGGMSRVFVAHETALGRQVVVKVLLPELAAGVNIERFRREIQLAAQLQHPHIVPLLSAGEADGLPYFIMPFVTGESLRARVTRQGELPIGETVRILRDVVSALAYAHGYGVVHRDVKPDNVLLSGGVAVVTDFGVAKAVTASSDSGATGLTSLGVALGTPAYMAPEQATANPQTDHRADIYSLGAMAYELLTGMPPFAGRPPQAVLAAHVIEDPEPVERRRSAVPPMLAALVRDCMAKRPADRPQTAAQIMHVLDSIATPTGGTAATTAVRVPALSAAPPSRRWWVLVGSALGLAALLAAGAVILNRQRAVTPPAALPPRESTVAAPAPTPPVQQQVGPATPEARPAPAAPVKSAKPKPFKPAAALTPRPTPQPEQAVADSTHLAQQETGPVPTESVSVSPPAPTPAPTVTAPTPPSETTPLKPPVAAAKPPVPAAPAAPTSAEAQGDIADLVKRYAAAIEARNLAGLQRVYPGMTGVQQRGWEQFFQLVRNVDAELALSSFQLVNGGAESQVTGTYSYLNTSTGRSERQPVSFHATFRRQAGQWQISQVR